MRKRGLHDIIEHAMLKELGRRSYMALRRAQRAGYTFKLCREKDGRLTVRPFNGIMNDKNGANQGALMRACYFKWGRKKHYKTWHALRLGKAPFGKTWKTPEVWKRK